MPTIACEHCDGSGRRELRDHEREVLAAVGRDWTPTADINHIVRIKRPALCNRLVRLTTLGLVIGRQNPANAREMQWRRP